MRSAIEAQRLSRKWTKDDGEFVPEFATWLRNARWLDEVCAPVVAARPWHETRGGINARAIELGLGPWDEAAFSVGAARTSSHSLAPWCAPRKRQGRWYACDRGV